MPDPLTRLERRILDYIVDYLRRNTYQPSIREIGDRFRIRSTKTVAEHLQSLADKGWIERDRSRSRGVRLLTIDLQPDVVTVPVYGEGGAEGRAGGAARRGSARAREKAPDHYDLDRRLVGENGSFFVRMRGDAMEGVGIQDGDLVLVDAVAEGAVQSGDIVAASVAGVLVVRILQRRGATLALEPAGSSEPTIVVSPGRDVKILGRASGVFRRLARGAAARAGRRPDRGAGSRAADASA